MNSVNYILENCVSVTFMFFWDRICLKLQTFLDLVVPGTCTWGFVVSSLRYSLGLLNTYGNWTWCGIIYGRSTYSYFMPRSLVFLCSFDVQWIMCVGNMSIRHVANGNAAQLIVKLVSLKDRMSLDVFFFTKWVWAPGVGDCSQFCMLLCRVCVSGWRDVFYGHCTVASMFPSFTRGVIWWSCSSSSICISETAYD